MVGFTICNSCAVGLVAVSATASDRPVAATIALYIPLVSTDNTGVGFRIPIPSSARNTCPALKQL